MFEKLLAMLLGIAFIASVSGECIEWQPVRVRFLEINSVSSVVDYDEHEPISDEAARCCRSAQEKDLSLACHKNNVCRLNKADLRAMTGPANDDWDCWTTGDTVLR